MGPFYKDLTDPRYTTPFAIYHRRFSTNTTPKWPLAQPMRVLGHNGEINTLQGNLNWVASRQAGLRNDVWLGREHDFLPLCSDRGECVSAWLSACTGCACVLRERVAERVYGVCVRAGGGPRHRWTVAAAWLGCLALPSSHARCSPLILPLPPPHHHHPHPHPLTESDSANLDHVAELMVQSGADPQEALMALVPEAYRNHPDLVANYPEVRCEWVGGWSLGWGAGVLGGRKVTVGRESRQRNNEASRVLASPLDQHLPRRHPSPWAHRTGLQVVDFYEYYEGLQEGWDGPALLVFSDGNKVGCRLDRNGLRPARFWQTADGMVYVASEVGVLGDVMSNAGNIVAKGRLGPGQMVCADLAAGTFRGNTEIARDIATRAPYKAWVQTCARKLADMNCST